MKNAQPPKNGELSTNDIGNYSPLARFEGTKNPRHRRALRALLDGSRFRRELDSIAGALNSPQVVAQLRRKGLQIPCVRIEVIDRDGQLCRPGIYYLTDQDRCKVLEWFRKVGD